MTIRNVDVQVTITRCDGEVVLHAVGDDGQRVRLCFEPMVGMTLGDRIIMESELAGTGA